MPSEITQLVWAIVKWQGRMWEYWEDAPTKAAAIRKLRDVGGYQDSYWFAVAQITTTTQIVERGKVKD